MSKTTTLTVGVGCAGTDLAVRPTRRSVRRRGRVGPPAEPDIEEFQIEPSPSYRRHLPHLRMEGATYFVTWRLHRTQSELSPDERDFIEENIRYFYGQRYELSGYVVMNDHVHVIVRPVEEWKGERLVYTWKNFTAKHLVSKFGRKAPVWLDEYYDHIIRNEADLVEKLGYTLTNPQRRWPALESYKWVWSLFGSA